MIPVLLTIGFLGVGGLTIPPQLQCKPGCESEIYCRGDLLKDVQLSGVYNLSKYFVDMKLLSSEKEILSQYAQFKKQNPNPTKIQWKSFLDQYFADDPLESCELPDYNDRPAFVETISDEHYQRWALEVNSVWKKLASRVPADVKDHPERHSYLYVPNCFIKAGGFFTEMYYWDSYWILEGLLLCDMRITAKGMIENFFHLIDTLGYMPNANRKYYIGRSQPPLLTKMVDAYYTATQDEQFLTRSLQVLEKEFQWWQNNRMVDVVKDGRTYKLARYNSEICEPRPEGFTGDYALAVQAKNTLDKQKLMVSTRSSAESGWDFSTRQMRKDYRTISDEISLMNLDTQNIIMVDLNAFIHFNVAKLAEWYEYFNNTEKAERYAKIADQLFEAIQQVLWNEEDSVWYDWDLVQSTQRKNFYPSNLTPLWTGSFKKCAVQPERVLQYLVNEGMISKNFQPLYYGIPTSKCNSTQQWDYMNEWPPTQAIVIEGLRNLDHPQTDAVAFSLSTLWLKTNYAGFQRTGKMYEKYNAVLLGQSGNGGEYITQIGFGWSNGFSMSLLHTYGDEVGSNDDEDFVPAPAPKNQCWLTSC